MEGHPSSSSVLAQADEECGDQQGEGLALDWSTSTVKRLLVPLAAERWNGDLDWVATGPSPGDGGVKSDAKNVDDRVLY